MDDEVRILPAVELSGSPEQRLKTIDAAIEHLQRLRRSVLGDAEAVVPPHELHGPYLNAPSWPWFLAGWVVGALFVLLFVLAWSWA